MDTEKLLREKMFDLVTDPPCHKCEFWDRQGHYCFSKTIHKTIIRRCDLLDQALSLFKEALPALAKEAGYVQLAKPLWDKPPKPEEPCFASSSRREEIKGEVCL